MTEQLPFSKVDQIGVVVRDLDKAVEHYQSLGIGPFSSVRNVIRIEAEMWGRPVDVDSFKVNIRSARIGAVVLELMQPIEGKSFWKDFLDTHGEGVHHLGFYVDDVEKETAKLEKKGFKVIYRARFRDGGAATFIDTSRVGSFFMELIQRGPE